MTTVQDVQGRAVPSVLEALLARREAFLAFVERRVSDPALAEDILQGAYFRALAGDGAPPAETAAVAWFYAVLRNAVIDHYRRRETERKHFENGGDFDLDEVAAHPAEAPVFVCRCIQQVLPRMKPAYAEILQAVDLDEQPLPEFAAAHGLTAGNAAVRAHRARKALRVELAAFCGACTASDCVNWCACAPEKQR